MVTQRHNKEYNSCISILAENLIHYKAYIHHWGKDIFIQRKVLHYYPTLLIGH